MSISDDLLAKLRELVDFERWYTVKEFGKLEGVRKAEFTVRQWCNRGRINAQHSMTRCGLCQMWVISHQEYLRYKREGLLPENPDRNDRNRQVESTSEFPLQSDGSLAKRPKPKPQKPSSVALDMPVNVQEDVFQC